MLSLYSDDGMSGTVGLAILGLRAPLAYLTIELI